jgi:hypothetical protein
MQPGRKAELVSRFLLQDKFVQFKEELKLLQANLNRNSQLRTKREKHRAESSEAQRC